MAVSTISRRLKDVLELSRINIDIFKAHSMRSASASKAFLKGASEGASIWGDNENSLMA